MGLAAAVGVGVAIVVGEIADGIIAIGVTILACADGIRACRCQSVQPIIAEALHLTAVDRVGQAKDVAAIVEGIIQILQIGSRRGCARTDVSQTERIGAVVELTG